MLDAANVSPKVQYGERVGGRKRSRLTDVKGEITKDPIYQDAERRFQELEKETKRLHEESKK
jgi:hypothetical protein